MVWDAAHQEIFNAIITEGEAMVRRSRDPRYAWLARRQRFSAADTARLREVASKMPEEALREALASVRRCAAADMLDVFSATAVVDAVLRAHATEHESGAVLRRVAESGRRRHRSLQNRLFLWLAALTRPARFSPVAAAIDGTRVAAQQKVAKKPRGQ